MRGGRAYANPDKWKILFSHGLFEVTLNSICNQMHLQNWDCQSIYAYLLLYNYSWAFNELPWGCLNHVLHLQSTVEFIRQLIHKAHLLTHSGGQMKIDRNDQLVAPQQTCPELGWQYGNLALPSQALTPPRAVVSLYLGVPKEWLSSMSSLSPSSKGETTLQRKTMLPVQLINHLSLSNTSLKGSVGPSSYHSKSAHVSLWLGYFWVVVLAPYANCSISLSHSSSQVSGTAGLGAIKEIKTQSPSTLCHGPA